MEGWCIVLYVIVHISVRRWAHGRVVEYTLSIKSSGTQFYKPDVASEMLSKPASGLRAHTTFGCDCFGGSWSSNGVFMAKLWPFYGYNIAGQTVNTTFKVSWSHRRAILHHSEWPIIFRVHKRSEDELLCTLWSKNNASTGEDVRVVAGWVIDHVKHEFLGFDATKSLLHVLWMNMFSI